MDRFRWLPGSSRIILTKSKPSPRSHLLPTEIRRVGWGLWTRDFDYSVRIADGSGSETADGVRIVAAAHGALCLPMAQTS
jgi:hypothetical protein